MYIQRMIFLQTLMIFSDTVRVAVAPSVFSEISSVNVIVLHLVSCSVDFWKKRFAKKSDLYREGDVIAYNDSQQN